jgi:hypothetical protein
MKGKFALLVAALAVAGGLQSAGAVERSVREAAATPPERDFSALIDMARQALNTQINAGRAPNDQVWVCIEAMYSDRVVVEYGGKCWQYPYSITVVDGNEQFTLGAPTQVVEQFTPVSAAAVGVTEANRAYAVEPGASFREAADGSIEVTIIRAGQSANGNFYPATVLKEAVPMFEGVRVFAKSDVQHIKGEGKDVRGLLGGIYNVRFVEGATPDTGALVGTFRPLDPTDTAVTKMTEAVKRGMTSLLGLSIDAVAKTKYRTEGGKRLREASKFTKVNSVDLIVEPGAGGGLDRLTEAAAETHQGESTMPLWKQRMLEAIKAKDPAKHAAIDPATAADDAVVNLFEAVFPGVDAARAAITLGDREFAGMPALRLVEAMGAPASGGQRVTEANAGDNTPVTRAELQMIELRQRATAKISASKLPQVAKDKLQGDFAGRERFAEADVDKAITAEGEYLARFTESGAVRVPMFGTGSIQVGDRSVAIKDMLDAFFDPAHKDHKQVRSFKECYIEITGDRLVSGDWRNVDKGRLTESLGEFFESVDSSTFANALGNSITRRMQTVFTGLVDLQTWRKVATVGSVNDFRTQERFRVGGYGNLPAVAQSGAYTALSSPSDAKTTYAVTKRGGTEDVTLEAIKNDDVNALRRIPQELAIAAANTLYEFVFDFFRTNPNAYDGTAIYHASHNNLFVAALSATEFATHRLAMVKQTRAGSSKRLGVTPRRVLVPFDLAETAYNLFVRGTNLDKTFVQDIAPEIIAPAYWTDTNDWVTVADPDIAPVLEISFLDGKEDPELFVQDMPNVGSMFSNDKLTYKIRHIYGGADLVDGFKFTTKAVVP